MELNNIKNALNQLAAYVREREFDQACRLAGIIFNRLLKELYAQVRGHASAAVMRSLLELEIRIGGDDGDFRDFDNDQMMDLFTSGDVIGHIKYRMAQRPALSSAVGFDVVARWLQSQANEDESPRPASVGFIAAWLRLWAEETGLVEPEEDVSVDRPVPSKTVDPPVVGRPDALTPFSEPITGMTFVFVPGDTFSMGDTFNQGVEDEKPVHKVILSDYYMAISPVTQAQWNSLMAENPSNVVGDDHPVEQVTLADVLAFIDKLNMAAGPGMHFDLPSEAQWEYAARSGGRDELYAGAQDPAAVACFEDTCTGGTAPVGSRAPNGLGLYDMSGNVWEWCRDIYHPEAYRRHDEKDPVCTSGGTDRVIRGGSWHLDAWSARCSRRFRFDPELYGPGLGFRLVMVIEG